ncbi:MAG: GcrA family cell cycle regulator [Pseudomonadota bacterium]
MSWTDERIEILRKLWEEGHPASHIAEQLGGVTRNAVIGKAHRLGLEKRPSPVKSPAKKTDKAKAAKPAAGAKAKDSPEPVSAAAAAKPKVAKSAPGATAAPSAAAKPAVTPADAPKVAADTGVDTSADADEDDDAGDDLPIAPKVPLSARSDVDQSTVAAPRIQIHDPRPAPRPAPKKPLRPARMSDSVKDKTSILELSERVCKWPIGHPGEAEFHFCGAKSEPGFPYCNEHCAVAYQAPAPRKDRPGRTPMPNLPRPR